MKTILRTLAILLFTTLVSGILYLSINSATATGTPANFNRQQSGMDGASAPANGQFQGRPDGDRQGGGGGQGLVQVLVTLAKLTGITVIVLLIQKAFTLIQKRIPRLAGG